MFEYVVYVFSLCVRLGGVAKREVKERERERERGKMGVRITSVVGVT
jgi:hypothetical protein